MGPTFQLLKHFSCNYDFKSKSVYYYQWNHLKVFDEMIIITAYKYTKYIYILFKAKLNIYRHEEYEIKIIMNYINCWHVTWAFSI